MITPRDSHWLHSFVVVGGMLLAVGVSNSKKSLEKLADVVHRCYSK